MSTVYNDILKDPRWKEKRDVILNRDGHKCLCCGSTKNLQVHHTYYERLLNDEYVEPWDYPDYSLITLCNKCHIKWHTLHQIGFRYRIDHNCLVPGSRIDEKVVAPPVFSKESLFQAISELKNS